MAFQIGDTVGDYEIVGVLGAGGMGKVYKVKNTISDRIDAMKVLLPNLADDQELEDRFTREIKVLASLNHPNIAGLRTAFRLENQLLMVMEFVEGTTLDDKIKAGPIPVEEAIGYIMQVLAALGYAHKHGVIHRDIKPSNMMLTPDNVIKLMDFGIAKTKSDKKLTQTGSTLGSLFYMSAEQVQGNELDGRSDLYSVGVSLYEMVTGSRPFKGKSDFDIMIAQLQQVPMAPIEMMPNLPRALNDIIVISLEKDPAKRFQTAEAFSAALGSIGHALNATPAQAATADMMPTVTAPAPPMPTQPLAVGGTISTPRVPTTYQPTVTAPQPGAPVAAMPPPTEPSHGVPAPTGSKGYRGLYMTLGALIALAIIILAATQLPRIMKTQASSDQTAQVNTPAAPNTSTPNSGAATTSTAATSTPPGTGAASSAAASTSPTPDAGVANGGVAAGNPGQPPVVSGASTSPSSGVVSTVSPASQGRPSTHGATKPSMNGAASPSPAGGGGQAATSSVPSGAGQVTPPAAEPKPISAQELAELSEMHDKLAVRAQTENDSVEHLRKQMAAGGNNLRSDISAAQTRMKMYMDKFDAAMNAGDPEAAKKYMSLAEREVETLEKFFNH
jgi:serine/threonine-protein kinase